MLRVIHPNRWFFWTIAAILIVGLVVIYYLQAALQEMRQHDTELASTVPLFWTDPQYPGWHTFRPANFGLSLKYPGGWQIEVDRFDANTVTLESAKNFDENVTVTLAKPSETKIIRSSIKIASEEPISVDGELGTWSHGADAKDKAMSNVVLVQHAGKLYYIAGGASQFEKIVGSIRFIQ